MNLASKAYKACLHVIMNHNRIRFIYPDVDDSTLTMSLAPSTSSSPAKSRILQKKDDDVVIVAAVRTAITKAKKGGFKDTHPELLLSHVLRAVYTQPGLDPALIEDISVGNVLPVGGGANAARMASLHAGIPVTTSINTVNRQCSSGLTSINQIANEIATGQIDIGIGASCLFLLSLQG